MTTYAASASVPGSSSGTQSLTLAIIPGSYEIRVPQAMLNGIFGGNGSVATAASVSVYSTGAAGGSAVNVAAMRAGSPAATATARSNASGSGTQNILGLSPAFSALAGQTFTDTTASLTFQPPFDVIVAPGSALVASLVVTYFGGSAINSYGLTIVVYFEELRLSWHY